MSTFAVRIIAVATNGPYAYSIFKDGVGQKDVNTVATISAALDGVKTDIGGLLNGQTVSLVAMTITSA